MLLFFAEDLHGFDTRGATRGEERGGRGDDEGAQHYSQERGKIGGGDLVEQSSEQASGGDRQGKAGQAAGDADG